MKPTSVFSKIVSFVLIISLSGIFINAKDPVRARKGMIVSSEKIATEIGVKILKQGGNAVDAAVAVGFALSVTFPYAGNIGGGGFMVIHLADGKNITLDFREKAPSSAFRDMFIDSSGNLDTLKSQYGWGSAGVPGTVAGLILALEKYGTMSLKEVIQPAIDLAEEGFPVSYKMAASINRYNEVFNRYESSRKIFTKEGAPLAEDEMFIQKDLAKTLRLIREYGIKGFYEGETAELIAEQSKKAGAYISPDDLKKYSVAVREPVYGKYKDYEIISMAPPSSGGTAIIETLNILEHYSFEKDEWGSGRYYKVLTDALKYAYYDRARYLGDPDFVKIPIDTLLSKKYAERIYKKISENIFPTETFKETKERQETTHYSAADALGNAVSVTYTVNSAYGSKVVVEGAGFLMNNEMDDFSAKPGAPNQFGLVGSEANSIQPGKRMLSSMSPVIVLKNGRPYIVTGSPGGATIITSVLQVVLNVLEFGMNICDAVEMPRIHHQYLPNHIEYEKFGLSRDVREHLIEKGEKVKEVKSLGCVESILIDDNGIFWGAADPRGYGLAEGF